MKSILVAILFIATPSCFAQVVTSSKHVKIMAASEMSWSPGMVQQNSKPEGGKIYELAIKIRKRGDYIFEKIIVDNQSLDAEMVKDGQRGIEGPYKKCSKWQVVSRTNKKDVKEISDPALRQLVDENKSVAGWIQYKFEGETLLTPVNQFESKSEKTRNP